MGADASAPSSEEAWFHSAFVWADTCQQILRNVGREMGPVCRPTKVELDRGIPAHVEATNDKAKCGIWIYVGAGGRTERSDWAPSKDVYPGWTVVTRVRMGLDAEVAARSRSARGRDAILSTGKRLAESCLAKADDGYQEYRLIPDGPSGQTGHCMDRAAEVGLRLLVIHAKADIVEYELGRRSMEHLPLRRDGEAWVAERTYSVEGPLHGCGPAIDCAELLGSQTVRWRFEKQGESITGTLTSIHEPLLKKEDRPGCQVIRKFRGSLVPQ
jgi:hypothetical protein